MGARASYLLLKSSFVRREYTTLPSSRTALITSLKSAGFLASQAVALLSSRVDQRATNASKSWVFVVGVPMDHCGRSSHGPFLNIGEAGGKRLACRDPGMVLRAAVSFRAAARVLLLHSLVLAAPSWGETLPARTSSCRSVVQARFARSDAVFGEGGHGALRLRGGHPGGHPQTGQGHLRSREGDAAMRSATQQVRHMRVLLMLGALLSSPIPTDRTRVDPWGVVRCSGQPESEP